VPVIKEHFFEIIFEYTHGLLLPYLVDETMGVFILAEATMLVFFSAATRTGIVSADFHFFLFLMGGTAAFCNVAM